MILSWNILRDSDDKLFGDHVTLDDIAESDKLLFRESTQFKGTEDKRVVKSLLDAMMQFDRVVGYYSTGYDIPFIRTRSVITGNEFPEYGTIYHSDAYYTAKFKFKLLSNKQEHVARALLGDTQKTRIEWPVWRAAGRGNQKALDYVVQHNEADVKDLKRIYYAMLPFKAQTNRSI
jgi:uncharacterized protein YprB with RNaseH-like and TPR domain